MNYENNTSPFNLTCELECTSNNALNISWYALNGSESKLIKTSEEFTLSSSEFDSNETSTIYCLISSSVQYTNNDYEHESKTYFYLNLIDPATGTLSFFKYKVYICMIKLWKSKSIFFT